MKRKDAKIKRARTGPLEHSDDNGLVVLTCVGGSIRAAQEKRHRAACIPTSDPSDRAHLRRDPLNILIPAPRNGAMPGGEPRRYHASQFVGDLRSGVGIDSMFDAWWEVYLELTGAGIPLGGLRYSRQEEDALRIQLYLPADLRLRDVLHQRTRQKQTRLERELERAANRMLERDAADAAVAARSVP